MSSAPVTYDRPECYLGLAILPSPAANVGLTGFAGGGVATYRLMT